MYEKKNSKKNCIPPPKDILSLKRKHVLTDDTEKATQTKDKEFDDYYDCADTEKRIQDRDEEESEVDSHYNHIYKNSQMLSGENSINTEK